MPSITASPEMLAAIFEDEKISAREIFRRAQTNEPADGFALSASKQVRFAVETTVDAGLDAERRRDRAGQRSEVEGRIRRARRALRSRRRRQQQGARRPRRPDADVIYNGADDDGSGTTALLAMAEAAARLKPRPKRSLLFVWHAGEEHGLWGSAYYTQHPTVPLDRIVAQLNVDMIGRSRAADDNNPENKLLTGPNEVYVIGSKHGGAGRGSGADRHAVGAAAGPVGRVRVGRAPRPGRVRRRGRALRADRRTGDRRAAPGAVRGAFPRALGEESRSDGDGRRAIAVKAAIERLVYRRAKRFIVLSEAFGRLLVEQYGVPASRVEVVRPGVDLDRFAPGDATAARQRLGVPPNAFVTLAVRRLIPRVGLGDLLDAWARSDLGQGVGSGGGAGSCLSRVRGRCGRTWTGASRNSGSAARCGSWAGCPMRTWSAATRPPT